MIDLRLFTLLGFLAFSLSGCFVANEIFLEPDAEPEASLQERTELAVDKYIQSQLTGGELYKPFGYSDLVIKKPIELIQLEAMEKRYELNKADSLLADSIQQQRDYIHNNRIERTVETDHFFTLETDTSSIEVLEIRYKLNDTLGVTGIDPLISLNLPNSYKKILEYYFNEYTLVLADTYSEGRQISKSIYQFFKTQLETYETLSAKSAFLKHVLDVCLLVKKDHEFDPNKLTQQLFKRHLANERTDITEYRPLEFSTLYETKSKADDTILGYYFFHKFIGNYNEQKDTNVVLVEFSPYYEVDKVYQLDQPFEHYLNQTK